MRKIFLIVLIFILIFLFSFISANYLFPNNINVIEFYNQAETPYLEGHGLERVQDNFVINGCGDGTILDKITNFCWQRDLKTSNPVNWNNANKYCEDLVLAGNSDWEFTNRDKLMTITNTNTNICEALESYGFVNCIEDVYWTVDKLGGQGWIVDFSTGESKTRGVNAPVGRPLCFYRN